MLVLSAEGSNFHNLQGRQMSHQISVWESWNEKWEIFMSTV